MLRKRMQHLLGVLGLAVLLGAPIAQAQESPPVRVRGTIEQVDGPNLLVKSRWGRSAFAWCRSLRPWPSRR